MITTVTTTTTTTAAVTTTTVVGSVMSAGIFVIAGLIVLLIIRDILMCADSDVKNSSLKTQQAFSSFLRSLTTFIIPLIYVFISVIIYKVVTSLAF